MDKLKACQLCYRTSKGGCVGAARDNMREWITNTPEWPITGEWYSPGTRTALQKAQRTNKRNCGHSHFAPLLYVVGVEGVKH